MMEAIWERGYKAERNLSVANMEQIADDLGLNMRKFKRDMNGDQCRERIRRDQEQATRVGARGTPSFFINGRFLSGARPIDQFKTLIDEELDKANKAIRGGIKKRAYYDHIVKTGKKSLN